MKIKWDHYLTLYGKDSEIPLVISYIKGLISYLLSDIFTENEEMIFGPYQIHKSIGAPGFFFFLYSFSLFNNFMLFFLTSNYYYFY